MTGAVVFGRGYAVEHLTPECWFDHDVEEAFDHVERLDRRFVGDEVFADLAGNLFGRLAGGFHPRKHDNGQIAFKLFAGRLRHYGRRSALHVIKIFDGFADGFGYYSIN